MHHHHHHHTIFTKLINPVLRNIHPHRPPSRNKTLRKRKQPAHIRSLRLSNHYASYTHTRRALPQNPPSPSTPRVATQGPADLPPNLPAFQYLAEGTVPYRLSPFQPSRQAGKAPGGNPKASPPKQSQPSPPHSETAHPPTPLPQNPKSNKGGKQAIK